MAELGTAGGQRQALLVLGVHRSGTSALTLALNQLGWSLGRDLLAADANVNLHGFGENQAVVDLNETILRHFGRHWYQLAPLPAGWDHTAQADAFCEAAGAILAEQFADERRVVIKDPRLCLTLPLWLKALEQQQRQVRIILQLRHPEAVAQSLLRRDKLPLQVGYLLWLQHYLAAEYGSRGIDRRVLEYEHLMREGAPALRVYDDLDPADNGDCGLDPTLCHYASPQYSQPGAVATLCENLRNALLGLNEQGAVETDLPMPADLLASLGAGDLGLTLDASLQALVELSGQLVAAGARHTDALGVIADKDQQLADNVEYIARCEEVIRSRDADVEQVTAYAQECEQVVSRKDAEVDQATRFAAECEAVVKAKDSEIEEVSRYARRCEETVADRDAELLQIRSRRLYRLLHKLRLWK